MQSVKRGRLRASTLAVKQGGLGPVIWKSRTIRSGGRQGRTISSKGKKKVVLEKIGALGQLGTETARGVGAALRVKVTCLLVKREIY